MSDANVPTETKIEGTEQVQAPDAPVVETPTEPPKTEHEAMLLALQADVRALRDTLNKEKEQKEAAEKKLAEEQESKSGLENIVTDYRQRETSKHEKDFKENLLPYLESVKKQKPELGTTMDSVSKNIEDVILKTGFVGEQTPQEEVYKVLTACASAQKINNTTLANILKNEAEWGEKVKSKDKELAASNDEIAKLKAELEKLSKDNTNPVNHFESAVPKELEQPSITEAPVVPVVAHSEQATKAPHDLLFDMKPNNNWRSLWRSA